MIALGVLLVVIGLLVKISSMWVIGLALLGVGLIFMIWGLTGHKVGGRAHWY
ncbi:MULTISPECIES: DUF6131 family protein [Nocardiaceae]|jgi:hypothetical protein|uniref:DUF6131 family protein n=1 Tax=Nocardiaceae TaxID=85025 RepID=UPI000AC02400|nr:MULTISPECIES: DUF6131 family protein [Rhodococcus]